MAGKAPLGNDRIHFSGSFSFVILRLKDILLLRSPFFSFLLVCPSSVLSFSFLFATLLCFLFTFISNFGLRYLLKSVKPTKLSAGVKIFTGFLKGSEICWLSLIADQRPRQAASVFCFCTLPSAGQLHRNSGFTLKITVF